MEVTRQSCQHCVMNSQRLCRTGGDDSRGAANEQNFLDVDSPIDQIVSQSAQETAPLAIHINFSKDAEA